MKRSIAVLLVIGIAALAGLGSAWGQEKKIAFSLNAGVQTNFFNFDGESSSFDRALLTVDGRAGFPLGRNFEISPEVMAVFNYGSLEDFSTWVLHPGVMLNYRSRNFFAGAGAVLPIMFWSGGGDSGSETLRISPKVNIGYSFPNGIQLTAYYLCWLEEGIGLFDFGFAGLTLGYRF
ncbi:MAG: hypothetical protein ABFD52_13085 [Acidobacteriota bacterium]